MTSLIARGVIHIIACASFILLVAMVTRSVDGGKRRCPPGKFGHQCRLSCNCRGSSDCDDTSGICPESCSEGWSGSSCQRQNVALGMPTDMKTSDWSKGARAVDGDVGTCVTSSSNRTGWFRVDMLVQQAVFFMEIILANQSARPGRFRVHVSDYVDTFWGKPCASIPASHKRTNFSCDLPSSGRYFGIMNKEGQITLCEVSVFVCTSFTFGEDCFNECLCADPYEVCNPISGSCFTGCRNGYTGISCTTPCNYRYGKQCRHVCGNCYGNQQCDHVTGVCINGCAAGWTGAWCNQPCESGRYGLDCKHQCHRCLDNATCDSVTGLCPWRCESGWQGDRCDTECEPGYYGQSCEFLCGQCYGHSVCNRRTGICPLGCQPGFDGLFCTAECLLGQWGMNCGQVCGNCFSEVCDTVTGHCQDKGCREGWSGPRCDTECAPGYYGKMCDSTCGNCLTPCDVRDGTCLTKCLPGWKGRTCADKCSDYTYGQDCAFECGHCLNDEPCHHITGYCPKDCIPGYKSPLCLSRGDWLLDQLGKPNLLTLLVTCMLIFCSTMCGIIACLLVKWRHVTHDTSIIVQQNETHYKQTVV